MIDDFGSISDEEREGMEKQLPDYFARKLGTELIAFVAKDENRIVSVADFDVIRICETLCTAAENYYSKSQNKNLFDVDEIRIDTW